MAKNTMTLCIYIFGLLYLQNIVALKITSLDVPKTAWDAVKLNCKYELSKDDVLYMVKWYKDQTEFFRCLENGTTQELPLKDIRIYHTGRSTTGSCFFELTALTPKSGGEYTCEVDLDWPTFYFVRKTAHLQIVEPSKFVQTHTTENGGTVTSASMLNQGSTSSSFLIIMLTVIFVTCRHSF